MDEITQLLDKINKQVAILAHQVDMLQLHHSIGLIRLSLLKLSPKISPQQQQPHDNCLNLHTPPSSIYSNPDLKRSYPATVQSPLTSHRQQLPPTSIVAAPSITADNPVPSPPSTTATHVTHPPFTAAIPSPCLPISPTPPTSLYATVAGSMTADPSSPKSPTPLPISLAPPTPLSTTVASPTTDQVRPYNYSFGVMLSEILCVRPMLNLSLPKEQEWADETTANLEHKLFELMLERNGKKIIEKILFVFDPGGTNVLNFYLGTPYRSIKIFRGMVMGIITVVCTIIDSAEREENAGFVNLVLNCCSRFPLSSLDLVNKFTVTFAGIAGEAYCSTAKMTYDLLKRNILFAVSLRRFLYPCFSWNYFHLLCNLCNNGICNLESSGHCWSGNLPYRGSCMAYHNFDFESNSMISCTNTRGCIIKLCHNPDSTTSILLPPTYDLEDKVDFEGSVMIRCNIIMHQHIINAQGTAQEESNVTRPRKIINVPRRFFKLILLTCKLL